MDFSQIQIIKQPYVLVVRFELIPSILLDLKDLAQNQKLYLIIASTDFIYGTNYQFCHGYLSSDLSGMSQEKAIQAMGRVGRNKLQFDYSLRFRNDDILKSLFEDDPDKPEVANMARLFNS